MEWLAVARAVVPGLSATTRAVMTSQTLTRRSSSGSAVESLELSGLLEGVHPPNLRQTGARARASCTSARWSRSARSSTCR